MSDDVTICKLKCVIAVAQDSSESRAAPRLHTNQRSISRTIHEVEAGIGVRLFYTGTEVRGWPRPEKHSLRWVLHSVDQYERAVQRAQNVAKRQAGFLNVAHSSFLSPEM